MGFNVSEFAITEARFLPVFLVLDTSGSMMGHKIDTLNSAVKEMLAEFAKSETTNIEIHVAIITFGWGGVQYHSPLMSASHLAQQFKDFMALGWTPMGEALSVTKSLIEDKDVVTSRAYRPVTILISDGQPNDKWEVPLDNFVSKGRSAKSQRFAMGIEAVAEPLELFIKGTENPVFTASDAKSITEFFRFVTMSVVSRTQSKDANQIVALPAPATLKTSASHPNTSSITPSSVSKTDSSESQASEEVSDFF